MDLHVLPPDMGVHRSVQELLPWFAADALDSVDAALVREHLRNCARCRDDLALQRRLRRVLPFSDLEIDVDGAFAKLQPRLEPIHDERHSRMNIMGRLRALVSANPSMRGASWIGWGLAGQACVIALAAILLGRPAYDHATYRALGNAQTGASRIVVMFKPDTTEQQLRTTLQASGARLADGPTETGAYVLSVPGAERDHTIQTLRANPTITLAVPLDGGERR